MMSAISKSLRSTQELSATSLHGLVKIRISWFRQVGANQEVAELHRFLVGMSQLSSQQDSGLFGEVGGRLKSKGIVVDELLLEACALMLWVQHQYLSRVPVWD